MKRNYVIGMVLAAVVLVGTPVFAENINEAYNGSSSVVGTSGNSSDTDTVDLSDKSSDTVYSPSLENTTQSGQAAGQPIEQ